MKKTILLLVLLLAFPFAGMTQQKFSDKELETILWAIGQLYPEGFTISLDSLRQPDKGIAVSYAATQNSFDKKSLKAVIRHAHEHDNIIGGWYNPEDGHYYFDSSRVFPEDSLGAALAFARENGQTAVYDLAKDISIKSNYEQQDVRIILDCDMGSSTDDLFALMMLHRYMDMQRCNLIGVIVDRMGRAHADIVDVVDTYYGHPDIPIGLETQGQQETHVWIPYHNLAYARTMKGEQMFKRTVGDEGSYMEGYKLYRKLLSGQPDHSVTIVSIGLVTTLARLLESGPDEYSPLNGVELIRAKVKNIYAMGGVFGDAVEPALPTGVRLELAGERVEAIAVHALDLLDVAPCVGRQHAVAVGERHALARDKLLDGAAHRAAVVEPQLRLLRHRTLLRHLRRRHHRHRRGDNHQ